MSEPIESIKARQMMSTIPGETNPVEKEMAVRRVRVAGLQGCQLGLETVMGLVRVEVHDHGGSCAMPFATCVVDIWGGRLVDVEEAIAAHRPAGLIVVPKVWPATTRDRIGEWFRWWWWRMFVDPR